MKSVIVGNLGGGKSMIVGNLGGVKSRNFR